MNIRLFSKESVPSVSLRLKFWEDEQDKKSPTELFRKIGCEYYQEVIIKGGETMLCEIETLKTRVNIKC